MSYVPCCLTFSQCRRNGIGEILKYILCENFNSETRLTKYVGPVPNKNMLTPAQYALKLKISKIGK